MARTTDAPTQAAMNSAVGLMGQFDFEGAAAAFAKIARQEDAPPEALLNQALAIMNQSREGAQDEAMALLRAFQATEPSKALAERARYAEALCALYMGRASEAAPLLEAIARNPSSDGYAQYFAAQALEQSDQTAAALEAFVRAAAADSNLKSAPLGIQRCARKLGDEARAERALAAFEILAANPRAHAAEFKYTRLGALALAVLPETAVPTVKPAATPGAPASIFLEPREIRLDTPVAITWSTDVAQHAVSVDLDGDARLDLILVRGQFVADAKGDPEARTLVLFGREGGLFHAAPTHPLTALIGPRANSVLFGDIDGNGRVDVYVCRSGGNALLLQNELGAFHDATAEWKAQGPGGSCNDGALADLDHDGDLDLLLLYRDSPNELLANTGAEGFKAIGESAGIAVESRLPISVIVGDFDYDRDADIFILNEVLPHQLLLNERLWKWTAGTAPGISESQLNDATSSAAIIEIADLPLRRAVVASQGHLRLATRYEPIPATRGIELGVGDVTGDGHSELMVLGSDRIAMHSESLRLLQEFAVPPLAVRTQLMVLEPTFGAHLITLRAGAAPLLWEPGSDRGAFAAVGFSGRADESQSMRSNASGIGTSFAARTGGVWSGGESFRAQTGRSQSLAPIPVGVGTANGIELLEVEWSDGVLQSEINLAAGKVHAITETQRQLSSCPVLFAFDGTSQRFVTDLLGVGGVGFLLEPGVYAEPRPHEMLVLPLQALVPKSDGSLALSLGEPMEESCMLDRARLFALDLPAGWDIAPDERLGLGGAPPTSAAVAWTSEWLPRGNATLASADLLAVDPGVLDARFIGRLKNEQVIELSFDTTIESINDPWLVIDGWIEYPYCQTMFAAWQAGATYRAVTLEARGVDGSWVELVPEWGYPAGMPRRLALPIPHEKLPVGTTTLRLRTNMEIYFDSVRLVAREPLPRQPMECPLLRATLTAPGFALRTTGPQRQPFYDRNRTLPLWDCRHQRGLYTDFGDATELVASADGAPVIFGPGEEVSLEFASPTEARALGTTRRYLLEVDGWCKDMDLFTRDGETIDPLPCSPQDATAETLLRKSRTRAAGGR